MERRRLRVAPLGNTLSARRAEMPSGIKQWAIFIAILVVVIIVLNWLFGW
jgi:hypothetical protein